MPSSIWGVHMDALRQRYAGRVQILSMTENDNNSSSSSSTPTSPTTASSTGGESSADKSIVSKVRVLDQSGWDVTIHLPQGFPEDPPQVYFAGYRVPYRWVADSLLPEAVERSVDTLSKLAGSCGPICLNQLANSVADAPQCEAATNASALKALIDEAPIAQALQKELEGLWGQIERTATSNLEMQPKLAALQHEVATAQTQVKNGLSGLGNRRKEVLEVLPLGSYEGLLRAAREEAHKLEEAAAHICKALVATGKRNASSGYASGSGGASNPSSSLIQAHLSMITPGPSSISSVDLPNVNTLPQVNNNNNNKTNSPPPPTSSEGVREAADTEDGSERNPPPPVSPTLNATPPAVASPGVASSLGGGGYGGFTTLDPFQRDIDDDDDDEEMDEMDRMVERTLKVCIEARRAALLLRRFQAPQDNKS